MKRLVTRQSIGEALEIDLSYETSDKPLPIDNLINFLNRAKEQGAEFVEFENIWDEGFVEALDIQPFITIDETDEEFEDRKQKGREAKESVRITLDKMEKAEFERLKKKFEAEN